MEEFLLGGNSPATSLKNDNSPRSTGSSSSFSSPSENVNSNNDNRDGDRDRDGDKDRDGDRDSGSYVVGYEKRLTTYEYNTSTTHTPKQHRAPSPHSQSQSMLKSIVDSSEAVGNLMQVRPSLRFKGLFLYSVAYHHHTDTIYSQT